MGTQEAKIAQVREAIVVARRRVEWSRAQSRAAGLDPVRAYRPAGAKRAADTR